jgi:exodeoxyribonuclease-3
MRLATWNVNSLTARLPRLTSWMEEHQPDVLCLQETKQSDDKFPLETFDGMGYEFGAVEDTHGCRFLAATCAGVRVHSVYVPNGRSLDDEFYQFKLDWLARLRTVLDETCPSGTSVAVCGDFNVAPADRDVWDPAHFVGMTHVSESERAALRHVEDWGLEDVFTRFNDPGTFTWWDYRAGDFHQGRGMRIDLLLVSQDLAARATAAFRDRDARKGQKPSDHAPVVVDFTET